MGQINKIAAVAPVRRQAIIWIDGGIVYWRIYASLDLSELNELI